MTGLFLLYHPNRSLTSESLVLSLRRLHILPPSSGGRSAVDGTPGRRQLAPSAAAAGGIKVNLDLHLYHVCVSNFE